jgi:UDP-galactopyranose mutase
MPKPGSLETHQKYKKEANKLKTVFFIGRLAQYKYLNMDQVVDEGLKLFERLKK